MLCQPDHDGLAWWGLTGGMMELTEWEHLRSRIERNGLQDVIENGGS
jgi:hypothetical protein